MSVDSLSAVSANMGILELGQARNSGNTRGILLSGSLPGTWTTYFNLTATGSQPVFKVGGAVEIRANGDAFFTGLEFNAGALVRVGGPAGVGQDTRAQLSKRSDWHTQLTNTVNWSIAENGTSSLGSFADSRGLLVVLNSTEGHCGVFLASANSIALLHNPQGSFDNTKDNAGTLNLYFDNGNLGMQNNRGGNRTVRIMLIGGEPS